MMAKISKEEECQSNPAHSHYLPQARYSINFENYDITDQIRLAEITTRSELQDKL